MSTSTAEAKPKIYKALIAHAYQVGEERKTRWTQVGVAFPAKEGEGMNIELTPGLAVSGRLILRLWETKEDGGAPADEPREGFEYGASERPDIY